MHTIVLKRIFVSPIRYLFYVLILGFADFLVVAHFSEMRSVSEWELAQVLAFVFLVLIAFGLCLLLFERQQNERVKDFRLLSALGVRPGAIKQMFAFEILLYTIPAGVAAGLASVLPGLDIDFVFAFSIALILFLIQTAVGFYFLQDQTDISSA